MESLCIHSFPFKELWELTEVKQIVLMGQRKDDTLKSQLNVLSLLQTLCHFLSFAQKQITKSIKMALKERKKERERKRERKKVLYMLKTLHLFSKYKAQIRVTLSRFLEIKIQILGKNPKPIDWWQPWTISPFSVFYFNQDYNGTC